MIGVSPAPAGGRSLRSTSTISICGTSRKRGTRYREKCGFRIFPFSKWIDFEQRAAQAHNHRALLLILQLIRIHHRAAFVRLDHPHHARRTPRLDRRLPRRWPRNCPFRIHRRCRSLCLCVYVAPSKLVRRRLEHRTQPVIFQIAQPELQRLDPSQRRQLIHVGFAREMIRGRRQAPIRSLSQRRIRADETRSSEFGTS